MTVEQPMPVKVTKANSAAEEHAMRRWAILVAVSSVLLSGLSASLGYRKVLPPVVAGMAPMVVFGLLATYFALRVRGMFTRA